MPERKSQEPSESQDANEANDDFTPVKNQDHVREPPPVMKVNYIPRGKLTYCGAVLDYDPDYFAAIEEADAKLSQEIKDRISQSMEPDQTDDKGTRFTQADEETKLKQADEKVKRPFGAKNDNTATPESQGLSPSPSKAATAKLPRSHPSSPSLKRTKSAVPPSDTMLLKRTASVVLPEDIMVLERTGSAGSPVACSQHRAASERKPRRNLLEELEANP